MLLEGEAGEEAEGVSGLLHALLEVLHFGKAFF